MTAAEARKIAHDQQKTFEYEYECVIKRIKEHALKGKMFMPVPQFYISNQVREKLLQDGYTITDMTIYWMTETTLVK